MPPPNENEEMNSPEGSPVAGVRQESGDWHRRAGPVFKYGIATGFALIFLGGISFAFSLTAFFLEILVICGGLSIILGAFGSTAKVNVQGQSVVLVGVAAIAVTLFSLVLNQMDDRYVRVKIGGDVRDSTVDFVGDRNYLGAFQPAERSYDFIVFGSEIRRPIIALYVTSGDKTEYMFECIPRDVLKPYLASGKTLEWTFDKSNAILIDTERRKKIAELGPCREETAASPSYKNMAVEFFGFVRTAFAQDSKVGGSLNIEELVGQLNSDVTHVRRAARTQLANKGLNALSPLLDKLGEKNLTYRTRLGIIVALTEMMRANKGRRSEFIGKISDDDLRSIVDAAVDNDRTMRIYASEFLFDLADPRVVGIALDRFYASSDNGRYNLILIIRGAKPFMSDSQRRNIEKDLTRLKSVTTPKINDLIDEVISLK